MLEENENVLSRNKEHELAMRIIYQGLFQIRNEKEYDLVQIIEDTMNQELSEVSTFIKEVTVKAFNHFEEIENIIKPNCFKWDYNRINITNIAILYLGITEYKYMDDAQKAVIIDVCVTLAKKYSDEKDYRFINALLDKVLC